MGTVLEGVDDGGGVGETLGVIEPDALVDGVVVLALFFGGCSSRS